MNDCRTCKNYEPIEVNPLIVKSGGTFVARVEQRNLFCIDPVTYKIQQEHNPLAIEHFILSDVWKEISLVTLTDEIAKLRPMVFRWDDDRDIPTKIGELVAVTSGEKYPYAVRFEPQHRRVHSWKQARLATPEELQEANDGK